MFVCAGYDYPSILLSSLGSLLLLFLVLIDLRGSVVKPLIMFNSLQTAAYAFPVFDVLNCDDEQIAT